MFKGNSQLFAAPCWWCWPVLLSDRTLLCCCTQHHDQVPGFYR